MIQIMNKRKRKPRNLVKRLKQENADLKRWRTVQVKKYELQSKIDVDTIAIPELKQPCPFCGLKMDRLVKGYYYCELCNKIINPVMQWNVKLPV